MELYKKYMYIIGIFGQSVFYSQFYEIIQNNSAKDVSLFGFVCGLILLININPPVRNFTFT